jgi:hypothetical protein
MHTRAFSFLPMARIVAKSGRHARRLRPTAASVVYVRGFARQPPIPDRAPS